MGTETKHTPGPWHVANGVQIRSERDQIAKVWMMRNGEGKANARLITAAPELYEALRRVRDENGEARLINARSVLDRLEGPADGR